MELLKEIATTLDYETMWAVSGKLMLVCAALAVLCAVLLRRYPQFKGDPVKARRSRQKETANALSMLAMYWMMDFTAEPMAVFCAGFPVDSFLIHAVFLITLLYKIAAMSEHAWGYWQRIRAI